MDPAIVVTLIIATGATIITLFARNTRQAILFLSLQAIAIGTVDLVSSFLDLVLGLHLEALTGFSITFAEWFACAIVIPLIIHLGMLKTENLADRPVGGVRRAAVCVAAAVIPYAILLSPYVSFPVNLEAVPFSMLMFSLSVFFMVSREDPLKILVGLNMAENALYPLFSQSPLFLIALILVLMVFVTAAGVYIVIEAYRDYGTLSIKKWRRG